MNIFLALLRYGRGTRDLDDLSGEEDGVLVGGGGGVGKGRWGGSAALRTSLLHRSHALLQRLAQHTIALR